MARNPSPPNLPKKPWLTMYDLPYDGIEEPGMPDELHVIQPQLLHDTFCPANYLLDKVFSATDMYLYFDEQHPKWYKRPDWFGVVGVPRFYEDQDLRYSYVVWDEKVTPFIVVEMLSPGTAQEDRGKTIRAADEPPTKWQVYEQILKVPYYVLFNRHNNNEFRAFKLVDGRYQNMEIIDGRFFMPELEIGLGLWFGRFQGSQRIWLRFYDKSGQWILTPLEKAQQHANQEREFTKQEKERADIEKQRADQEAERADLEAERADLEAERAELEKQRADIEKQRAEKLAQKLRALGLDPDKI